MSTTTVNSLDWASRKRAEIANLRDPVLLDAIARMTDSQFEKLARMLRDGDLPGDIVARARAGVEAAGDI